MSVQTTQENENDFLDLPLCKSSVCVMHEFSARAVMQEFCVR